VRWSVDHLPAGLPHPRRGEGRTRGGTGGPRSARPVCVSVAATSWACPPRACARSLRRRRKLPADRARTRPVQGRRVGGAHARVRGLGVKPPARRACAAGNREQHACQRWSASPLTRSRGRAPLPATAWSVGVAATCVDEAIREAALAAGRTGSMRGCRALRWRTRRRDDSRGGP
jgi:hypothetical protein